MGADPGYDTTYEDRYKSGTFDEQPSSGGGGNPLDFVLKLAQTYGEVKTALDGPDDPGTKADFPVVPQQPIQQPAGSSSGGITPMMALGALVLLLILKG